MPYLIKMVCDGCGVEAAVPSSTLAEMAEVTCGFVIRVNTLMQLGATGETSVDTKCPKCSELPPAPGVVRVGGF